MDMFFRRNAIRPKMPIDKARQERLGQDAPSSPQRTSPIFRFAATIARQGESLPAKAISKHRLESPLLAVAPFYGTQSQPASPLNSSARGRRAPRLALSSDLRTRSDESFQEPCLAHPRGGCSCAVTQVATMTGSQAWKVMGRRFKVRKQEPSACCSDSLRDAHRPVAPHQRLPYGCAQRGHTHAATAPRATRIGAS